MLFSGSIRNNVDPFSTAASDAQVWEALHRVGVKPAVVAMQVSHICADWVSVVLQCHAMSERKETKSFKPCANHAQAWEALHGVVIKPAVAAMQVLPFYLFLCAACCHSADVIQRPSQRLS